ncbi:MAG: hypothetical protein II444_04100 [Firmicutes bacterium]|nr:hypothetical protein [Bacillota bacterium]
MRIEISEKGTRGYYDELAYIKLNFSKVLDNPGKPAKTMTGYVMTRVIGFLVVVAAAFYLYTTTKDIIYAVLSLAMVVAEIAIIISLVNGMKKARSLKEEDGPYVIEIDEEGVRCIKEEGTNELKWDDILCIAINRYSIAVLPKEVPRYGIYANLSYKDQIISAVREAGHFYMIEDNTPEGYPIGRGNK